jgi:hypothetical protein
MAEEMAIGTPVIATGYSGNTTFMTRENSLLVHYTLERVPPGCEPYPVTSRWARPKVPHAARLMRRVFEDADLRERLGARAAADIAEFHSIDALARFAKDRLSEIAAERKSARKRDGGALGRIRVAMARATPPPSGH